MGVKREAQVVECGGWDFCDDFQTLLCQSGTGTQEVFESLRIPAAAAGWGGAEVLDVSVGCRPHAASPQSQEGGPGLAAMLQAVNHALMQRLGK